MMGGVSCAPKSEGNMKPILLSTGAVERVYHHPSMTDPQRIWYIVTSALLAFFFLSGFHTAADTEFKMPDKSVKAHYQVRSN
jgi:hypothetical protein